MFAAGLLITARAGTPAAAGVSGSLALYPMPFFAGLRVPGRAWRPSCSGSGNFTPPGAAGQAMGDATQGLFPGVRALLLLTARAVAAGVLAVRYLRWE